MSRSRKHKPTKPTPAQPTAPPLPNAIATRLATLPTHVRTLKGILERAPKEEYVAAVEALDPNRLVATVYPLERGFEVLVSFILELAEQGLKLAGIKPERSRKDVLRQLVEASVISRGRCDKLIHVYGLRNVVQHQYPDATPEDLYGGAQTLMTELPGFIGDYRAWMRRLGHDG
jgi:uncharacterized protein YutE (UPF0331/DUF86 family)